MKNNKIVIFIIVFWALVSFSAVIKNEITLNSKTTVYLKTVPVDPRDIFMGDYVILNYKIAQNVDSYKLNKIVYVVLDVDKDGVATRKLVTADKPKERELYIKGRISKCPTTIAFFKTGQCVNMGIESYYVKEGEGKKLEKDLRNGALVEVKISKNGLAKVVGFKK